MKEEFEFIAYIALCCKLDTDNMQAPAFVCRPTESRLLRVKRGRIEVES